MRNFLILLSLILFVSCGSQKYIKKAQFDSAIAKSVKKIRKKPNKTKEIETLNYAYSKANKIDLDRLEFLYESGEDDIWTEVYNRYSNLNRRQDLVKTLPDHVLQAINYEDGHYAKKLTDSKKNAAEFYYLQGTQLLESKDKYKARDAYYSFVKVTKYYSNYKDTEKLIEEARFYGINNVLFRIENNSRIALPAQFEEELLKISLKELNETWINYDTSQGKDMYYDYYIQLSLKSIISTPESIQTEKHTEEKEIEDGFRYLLDAKGNVTRDSLGNDIKLPVYKIITCDVVETSQLKKTLIEGTLDYIDTKTNQLIKTHPISTETIFDHHSAICTGNMNALTEATYKIVKQGGPIPFPTSEQMIMDTALKLKTDTKRIISTNRNWLQN